MWNQQAFPWGVYIGDLLDEQDNTMPLLLDSKQGGFCVIFDEDSEETAANLIENVALKLLDVVPFGNLVVDVFDFSVRQRFKLLAELKRESLYSIAINQQEATHRFDDLEKIALHRHHNILNARTPDVSTYNQTAKFVEKYHLILLNLEHFPNEFAAYSRLKSFINSNYEAGFYIIAFGSQEILQSQNKATQYLLNKKPAISVTNNRATINPAIFSHADLLEGYRFEYLNLNKTLLLEKIRERNQIAESKDKEFLSVPIGTTLDGREPIIFSLGDKSKNYHAFIAGRSGSGKTTLLNNLIVGIAKQYTADEVRLYLMDYKAGVEFQIFANHPNCETIYLDNQNVHAAIELLQNFVNLKEQRSQIFQQHQVNDLNSYNQLATVAPLPRLLLIIDEVHQLFSNSFSFKEQNHFNALLEDVAKQGRSFGMHIILTTQSPKGINISEGIMSQIPLRISYILQNSTEAMKIFNEQNTDAVCKLSTYEFIYNNQGGNKIANLHGRADYTDPKQINALLEQIARQRTPHQIIKPLIIQKSSLTDNASSPPIAEPKPNPPTSTPEIPVDNSMENHKALLAKLKAWQETQPNDQ